jgi:hypothetical protein
VGEANLASLITQPTVCKKDFTEAYGHLGSLFQAHGLGESAIACFQSALKALTAHQIERAPMNSKLPSHLRWVRIFILQTPCYAGEQPLTPHGIMLRYRHKEKDFGIIDVKIACFRAFRIG